MMNTGAWIGMGIIGLFMVLLFIAIPIVLSIFWVWMIIDCAQRNFKNKNDKIIWILVVVLLHSIGAFIYYIVIKRKNKY
ncbi:MAG: PLDc N-terminal domain-containing protein [Nanoarchaeota archaeon]